MLRALIHEPTSAELCEFLDQHLRSGDCLVQVVGECEVLYHGRAASVAEAGDYVVMAKRDGSLQVHGHRGVKPVNWQPQSDTVRVLLEDGSAVLYSERFTPAEFVRVAFLRPVLAQALVLRETPGFMLVGSEAEMQRALARRPELIEEGLTLLDRELPTEVGGIDLYARDCRGNLVVVELKRGKAGQEAVHQLYRYVERVEGFTGLRVRGVLAAPAITAPALEQLQRQGLEFREITALPVEEDEQRQPSLFDTAR
ncbi:MAG: endonuclease NucS [Trueperaceae bacterium]